MNKVEELFLSDDGLLVSLRLGDGLDKRNRIEFAVFIALHIRSLRSLRAYWLIVNQKVFFRSL